MDLSKLEDAPVGLLPDSVLVSAYGIPRESVMKYREGKGIPRYSMLNNPRFPSKEGSFRKIIKAWGVERSRAWLRERAPNFLPYFELDVRGASSDERSKLIGNSVRGVESVTYPVLFLSTAKQEAMLEDKAAERKRIEEEMARFLARGGKKTVCQPAGWADKGPVAGMVSPRSSTGARAKAGG